MLWHRDHLLIRGMGTLFGLVYCLLGARLLVTDPAQLSEMARRRATGFGIT